MYGLVFYTSEILYKTSSVLFSFRVEAEMFNLTRQLKEWRYEKERCILRFYKTINVV